MKITSKFIKTELERKLKVKLTSKNRNRSLVYLRYVSFKLCKQLTSESLTSIGLEFKKDHATVIHGINQFNIHQNESYFKEYKEIYNKYLSYFLKLSDDKDFDFIKDINNIEMMKTAFIKEKEEIEVKLRNEYIKEIDKLNLKLERYEQNSFFSKIASLPYNEFNEIKERINAFLVMNGMNSHRKRDRVKIYEGY
jgi:hypothetical protein